MFSLRFRRVRDEFAGPAVCMLIAGVLAYDGQALAAFFLMLIFGIVCCVRTYFKVNYLTSQVKIWQSNCDAAQDIVRRTGQQRDELSRDNRRLREELSRLRAASGGTGSQNSTGAQSDTTSDGEEATFGNGPFGFGFQGRARSQDRGYRTAEEAIEELLGAAFGFRRPSGGPMEADLEELLRVFGGGVRFTFTPGEGFDTRGNRGGGFGGFGGFGDSGVGVNRPKRDYYEVIGVERTASNAALKTAYHKRAMQCHPDLHRGDKAKEAEFKELNEAYEVLKDPDKRAYYDRTGGIPQNGW